MALQAWTDIARSRTDTKSGLPTTLFADLENNGDHVRETIYDTATHTGATAHDHDGSDSALIIPPDVPNLVIDCHPSTEGDNSVNRWTKTGVGVTNWGLNFTATGQYATHVLGDPVSGRSKTMFGAGCPLVLSICARARTTMADLTLKFGITQSHSSTFQTSCAATITQATIGVGGYRRFYTLLDNYVPGAGANVLMGIATSGTFTSGGQVDVTLMLAQPTNILGRWAPAHRTSRQHNWELIGVGEVPTFDDELMFTRALYCAAA